MADTKLLDFTASVTPTQLDIRVKNVSKQALAESLLIEIKLPIYLVSSEVADAVEVAREKNLDANCTVKMESLANLVTVPKGWSSWAADEMTEKLAIIRIFNDRDQNNHTASPAKLDSGDGFTLGVPLTPQEQPTHVEIPYGYRYPSESREDKFEVATAGARTRKPKVSLKTNQASPSTIKPETEVTITWEVENGVSATLYGPLPGGNSRMSLSSDPAGNYNGSLGIYAVGPATYILQAEVRGSDGQPNEIVIKTLSIDIFSVGHYAYLKVRPDRVLPYGVVEVDWAVWGADKAFLVAGRDALKLTLTEQNLSGNYQGTGVWPVIAPAEKGIQRASLTIQLSSGQKVDHKPDEFLIEYWDALDNINCTGALIGMAVSGPKMALLTSEGLSIAVVGKNGIVSTFSRKSSEAPKAWLALGALDNAFLVLQRTNNDGIRVARYTQEGTLQGLAIDLPDEVMPIVQQAGSVFDLAVLGQRAYVVVETGGPGKTQRRAYSVRFDPSAEVRPEPNLERLPQYRVLSFDKALYALHRNSGQMLRFDLDKQGNLQPPLRAESAVQSGESMIRQGLLVPADGILLVLGPSSTPPLNALDVTGSLHYNQEKAPETSSSELPKDLVYNPQQNHWIPCGHGLDIERGAVAAFREGESKRLWVVQPDHKMNTLPGAFEHFFAPGYVDSFKPWVLPSLLDGKREVTIINKSGVHLFPVNDACRAADMDDITSDSLAELGSAPSLFGADTKKKVTILYNQKNPGTVRLHFMAGKMVPKTWNPKIPRLPSPYYLLQVTLSGTDLSKVSSVFTRLGTDGKVIEFTETRIDHPASGPVTVPPANRLLEKLSLVIVNNTTHKLNLYPSPGPGEVGESAKLTITYATPGFSISIPEIEKVGMSNVNFDFALPRGIELSATNEPQQSSVRVNTDHLHMPGMRVQFLKAGSPPFEYYRYDGSKGQIPGLAEDAYVCLISMRDEKDLPGVRLGDPAANARFLYVPLAKPGLNPNVWLWRLDLTTLAYAEFPVNARSDVFSLPNSVCVSGEYLNKLSPPGSPRMQHLAAMFSDKKLYRGGELLQDLVISKSFSEYDQISALAMDTIGGVLMIARKNEYVQFEQRPVYFLVRLFGGDISVWKLDKNYFPEVGPPLASSYDTRRVAIGKPGGLLVVDLVEDQTKLVDIPNAGEPAYVTFTREWIYCAHATRLFELNGPHQAVKGRDLSVTRLRIANTDERQTIHLPNVESDFAMTGNTRQAFVAGVQRKEEVAFTLAPSPDEKEIFVSASTSIMKIDTGSFTLRPWNIKVDLPCRLITVTEGWGNAWTLYALGSHYTGDGTTVDDYKTRLYKLPVPKG